MTGFFTGFFAEVFVTFALELEALAFDDVFFAVAFFAVAFFAAADFDFDFVAEAAAFFFADDEAVAIPEEATAIFDFLDIRTR